MARKVMILDKTKGICEKMSQRSEQAKDFMNKGHNCSQAVVYAFRTEIQLTEEEAINIAEKYASGTYVTCGTVLAMHIVINGIINKTVGQMPHLYTDNTKAMIMMVDQEFNEALEALTCRKLRENNKGEGLICTKCIEKAVQLLEEHLINSPILSLC